MMNSMWVVGAICGISQQNPLPVPLRMRMYVCICYASGQPRSRSNHQRLLISYHHHHHHPPLSVLSCYFKSVITSAAKDLFSYSLQFDYKINIVVVVWCRMKSNSVLKLAKKFLALSIIAHYILPDAVMAQFFCRSAQLKLV